jgi:hypothetical protein
MARMMLFDSKMPTRPSGLNAAGTVPNGWAARKESVLNNCSPLNPMRPTRLAPSAISGATSESGRVDIPEPVLQLPRQAAPNLDVDTADARGDRRLPNPWVRQIREDAELSHERLLPIADHQVSTKGRISTLNDHALRS